MNYPTTLTEKLVGNFKNNPEKTAVIFQKTGQPDIRLSYADLIEGSLKFTNELIKKGIKPGEVVIIILQHSLELIFSYFGTLLNGSIPSIMPFLTEKLHPDKYRDDLHSLIQITQPSAIITFLEFKPEIEKLNSPEKPICKIFKEELSNINIINAFDHLPGLERKPEDIVLLQHSSGTTGLQKGVALSHLAIFNQLETYSEAIKLEEPDVIASWLPLYHDMGLIASFLMPILYQIPLVLMSPFDWVRAPQKLFHAISIYKGTLCWLPNFAYNFCAKKIRLEDLEGINLSSLRAVINCSEPMRFDSHKMFLERFSPYGLCEEAIATCYAMAENVFAVTLAGIDNKVNYDLVDLEKLQIEKKAKPAENDRKSITMVSAGRALKNCQIKIVSENGKQLPDRCLGEILIKSDCMLSEYYLRKEDTRRSFEDGWFKTGDIGYLAEKELYISGRKKDMIIVGGKNIYPQDIELLVTEVDGVHPGRAVAFGIFNDDKGTEEVIVVAEVDVVDENAKRSIAEKIRHNVTQQSAITLRQVLLVDEKWLIKTSSGKTARNANREKYISQYLN